MVTEKNKVIAKAEEKRKRENTRIDKFRTY